MLEETRNYETMPGNRDLDILGGFEGNSLNYQDKEQLRINHEHMVHYLGHLVLQEDTPGLEMDLARIELFKPYEATVDDGIFEILARREASVWSLGEIAARGVLMSDNIGLVPNSEEIYSVKPRADRFGDPHIRVGSQPLVMQEDARYDLSRQRLANLEIKTSEYSARQLN